MKKLIQKTFLAFLLTLTFQASHTQAMESILASFNPTLGTMAALGASSRRCRADVERSAPEVQHWNETICYRYGESIAFKPTCVWVEASYPTPEQQAFQNKITQLGKNKVHINTQFYTSIVKIVLRCLLKALIDQPHDSYENHQYLAQSYIQYTLERRGRNNTPGVHEDPGQRPYGSSAWGRKTSESVEAYQQRIINSAQAMPSLNCGNGDRTVFNELVRYITVQFRPFDIQGQDPWFIPPQGGHNSINWFDFVMNARGKVSNFLSGRNDISQVNLRLFEGVTSVGDHFLNGCYHLKGINLLPLRNVTSVGKHFLNDCHGLMIMDYSLYDSVENNDSFHAWRVLCCVNSSDLRKVLHVHKLY